MLGSNVCLIVPSFQNLGILFIGKKEVPEILFQRKLEEQRLLRSIHNSNQLSGEC